MNELENFASRIENKKNLAEKKPGALVLGNAKAKLAFQDAEELSKITCFFERYGKDLDATSSFDLSPGQDDGMVTD